jgi:hypothetical protein
MGQWGKILYFYSDCLTLPYNVPKNHRWNMVTTAVYNNMNKQIATRTEWLLHCANINAYLAKRRSLLRAKLKSVQASKQEAEKTLTRFVLKERKINRKINALLRAYKKNHAVMNKVALDPSDHTAKLHCGTFHTVASDAEASDSNVTESDDEEDDIDVVQI